MRGNDKRKSSDLAGGGGGWGKASSRQEAKSGKGRSNRGRPQPIFEISTADISAKPDPVDLLFRRPVALLNLVPRTAVLFAAGAIAGALGKTVVAPLDRVKILLQVKGGFAGGAIQEAAAKGGVLRALVAVGRAEGVLGFWKGNLPQVLRVLPYSAAQLCSYEVMKGVLSDDDGNLPVSRRFLAGACAGMFSTLVTYPLDTLRLRLAVDPAVHTMSGACSALYREGGVPAFFRGLGPAIIGIAPYMALELAAFDLLPREMPSFSRGFTAALIATSFCYPLDTVRRQIQLQSHHGVPIVQTVKNIIKQDGVGGLYRGFAPNAIKNLPNKGIRLSTFETVKCMLDVSESAYQEEMERAQANVGKCREQRTGLKGNLLGAVASVSHQPNRTVRRTG